MTERITESPEARARRIIAKGDKAKQARKVKLEKAAEERAKYKKRKHLVKALEDDNHSKIIAFATLGETGFWKLIGNSAIYYAYHEAKRLGKDVKLQRDTDFYDKDRNGFVAIKNIETLEKDLEFLGGKLTEEIDDPDIKVFDMGVKFSDADLKTMMRRREMMVEQINKTLMPKVSDPELYKVLREILEKASACYRTTDPVFRKLVYEKVLESVYHAHGAYVFMARGNRKVVTAKKDMLVDLERIVVGLRTVQILRLWNTTKIWELSGLVEKGEKLIKKLGVKGNGNSIKE